MLGRRIAVPLLGAAGSFCILLVLNGVLASPPLSDAAGVAEAVADSTLRVSPWLLQREALEKQRAKRDHTHADHRRQLGGGTNQSEGTRRCVHDENSWVTTPAPQRYRSGRRAFSPLRLTFDYGQFDLDVTDAALNAYVKERMTRAKAWLESALKVQRVDGRLFVEPACESYWISPSSGPVTEALCGAVAGEPRPACGLQNVPDKYLGRLDLYNQQRMVVNSYPAREGAADTDVLVLVTMQNDADVCGAAGSGAIAWAFDCQRDQRDRPTLGHINWCPATMTDPPLSTRSNKQKQDDLDTAVHELLHVLGFSSSHFAFFRDATGNPRSPRCPGAAGCDADSDGGWTYPGDPPLDAASGMYRVAATTLATSSERGVQVLRLVTPEVKNAARKHFGCEALAGAELENGGGDGTALSHFEQRSLFTELMTGQSSTFESPKSVLTLAVLADSGWYEVDFSVADKLKWGDGWGCAFATEKCLSAQNDDHFCREKQHQSCTFDRSAVGVCNLVSWNSDLDAPYQYFSSDPKLGAEKELMDYCPIHVKYRNKYCDNSTGAAEAYAILGESMGPGHACFESTLFDENASPDLRSQVTPLGCYRFSCSGSELTLYGPDGSTQGPCTADRTDFAFTGFDGVLKCPADPAAFCAAASGKAQYTPVTPAPSDSGSGVGSGSDPDTVNAARRRGGSRSSPLATVALALAAYVARAAQ